jgi:RNA polymerase sigma factor (sigma-70 family)
MHTGYQSPILRQLRDQQVRFAPREQRLMQVNRTEILLSELDSKKTYTYEYLCFRITDFRPDSLGRTRIKGIEAAHDLRLFVEDLSESAGIPAEAMVEPVLTVSDLSREFNVSEKTISRWRNQGLVSRRFLVDGRKRIGFLRSSVNNFVGAHPKVVKRGRQFSQLTEDDRERIIRQARTLALEGNKLTEVSKRLAERMSRSPETIRTTLKNFDERNPDLAIFPNNTGPLPDAMKDRIYNDHRRGKSVERLAREHKRTPVSIYRIIHEIRANRILELPLDFMDNEEFSKPGVWKRILGPVPEPETKPRKVRVPTGLPPYLASLYEVPLLTREQEGHMFRKYNYLKYRAAKLRKGLVPAKATTKKMDEIERLYQEAVTTKNAIVRANLRLVVSIAKRHVGQQDNLFELISDGNMSLIRAVEKFDYARGNKFSTYASWAIMKNFARTIPQEYKIQDRFRTSFDEMFAATEERRGNRHEAESAQATREKQISRILKQLDEREQKIIISRFGLDHQQEPQTLKEVGAQLGVTKERIRQIEARALNKLRIAAQEAKIDLGIYAE